MFSYLLHPIFVVPIQSISNVYILVTFFFQLKHSFHSHSNNTCTSHGSYYEDYSVLECDTAGPNLLCTIGQVPALHLSFLPYVYILYFHMAYSSTLKTGTAVSSKTFTTSNQITRCHIPQVSSCIFHMNYQHKG